MATGAGEAGADIMTPCPRNAIVDEAPKRLLVFRGKGEGPEPLQHVVKLHKEGKEGWGVKGSGERGGGVERITNKLHVI